MEPVLLTPGFQPNREDSLTSRHSVNRGVGRKMSLPCVSIGQKGRDHGKLIYHVIWGLSKEGCWLVGGSKRKKNLGGMDCDLRGKLKSQGSLKKNN